MGKHRPASRSRLLVLASGLAVAVLAAGAWAVLNRANSTNPTPVADVTTTNPAPLAADPPRATPTRASRDGRRTDPSSSPSPEPTPTETETAKPSPKPTKTKAKPAAKVVSSGSCEASYYWQGQMTASGERFDPSDLTAAHKTLKFGTKVRVTNKNNGKRVTVRINDRGPFVAGRCLDLSRAAMQQVGGTGSGVIPVSYQVLAR
ncbi:septal ring lytic transglycosylase RlpA family protein [Actinomadura flavalba]|uniref:septal ring lytic transglycosylase RlpA family protein n=1 Tax=Actinomadura flavalba TaxID=1120938 RepID=UPI0003672FB3|nr:septal ring lytic transglycosylase RlpA family protein [Actinomadura flavalba]